MNKYQIKKEQEYTLNGSFKSFIEDMINYYESNKKEKRFKNGNFNWRFFRK